MKIFGSCMNGNVCICNNKKVIAEQEKKIEEQIEFLKVLERTIKRLEHFESFLEKSIRRKKRIIYETTL
jgi:hypothetical protein